MFNKKIYHPQGHIKYSRGQESKILINILMNQPLSICTIVRIYTMHKDMPLPFLKPKISSFI